MAQSLDEILNNWKCPNEHCELETDNPCLLPACDACNMFAHRECLLRATGDTEEELCPSCYSKKFPTGPKEASPDQNTPSVDTSVSPPGASAGQPDSANAEDGNPKKNEGSKDNKRKRMHPFFSKPTSTIDLTSENTLDSSPKSASALASAPAPARAPNTDTPASAPRSKSEIGTTKASTSSKENLSKRRGSGSVVSSPY